MRLALHIVVYAALAAYPLLIVIALHRGGVRAAAGLALAVALPRAAITLRDAAPDDRAQALLIPVFIALFAGGSALSGDPRLLLAAPTLINLSLLVHFARSLGTDTPLVERFARMQVGELSAAERRWCRGVTLAWSIYFAVNALLSALFALAAPLRWWAIYTGGVSYGLMGAMFTAEYLARTRRFRHYGDGPVDKVFSRIWPPSEGTCAKASS